MLRVVVKESFSREMAGLLSDDLQRTVEHLESKGPSHQGGTHARLGPTALAAAARTRPNAREHKTARAVCRSTRALKSRWRSSALAAGVHEVAGAPWTSGPEWVFVGLQPVLGAPEATRVRSRAFFLWSRSENRREKGVTVAPTLCSTYPHFLPIGLY